MLRTRFKSNLLFYVIITNSLAVMEKRGKNKPQIINLQVNRKKSFSLK